MEFALASKEKERVESRDNSCHVKEFHKIIKGLL
jgi:hypothetical protein